MLLHTAVNQNESSRHNATFSGVVYNVHKLIELAGALPEEKVDLGLFAPLISHQCWTDVRGQWLGPSDILGLAGKYACHWEAMILANLNWAGHVVKVRNAKYYEYPLLVVGERYVIDGMHRLTKAWLDQAATLRIKRFPELPSEAIVSQ